MIIKLQFPSVIFAQKTRGLPEPILNNTDMLPSTDFPLSFSLPLEPLLN